MSPDADDGVYTHQLHREAFGPWPRLRELLGLEGIDPQAVRVRHIRDGGHGMGTDEGQLFEFHAPGGRVFSARMRFTPTPDAVTRWASGRLPRA